MKIVAINKRDNPQNPERRIDHGDFREIVNVSYAKGVIKDFLIENEDPISVKPMVKVALIKNGKEEEYDEYIPIFYRPKKDYWDDEYREIKSLDYDEDKKYFKMSWQSFRGGDEVVVLCLDDKPHFVTGFYDNYPRVGEDVAKIISQPSCHYYNLRQKNGVDYARQSQFLVTPNDGYYWFENDIGPDGLPLHLFKKCNAIWSGVSVKNYPTEYQMRWANSVNGPCLWLTNYCEYKHFTAKEKSYPYALYYKLHDDVDCSGVPAPTNSTVEADWYRFVVYEKSSIVQYKVSLHLIPVGPILWALYSIWTKNIGGEVGWRQYLHSRTTPRDYDGEAAYKDVLAWLNTYTGGFGFCGWGGVTQVKPPGVVEEQSINKPEDDAFYWGTTTVKAGIYTPELYNKLLNSTLDPQVSYLIWENSEWSDYVDLAPYAPEELIYQAPKDLYKGPFGEWLMCEDDEIYVVPHTKEELMEAGLWLDHDLEKLRGKQK